MAGDPHFAGYCWCGINHSQVDWQIAFDAGRASGCASEREELARVRDEYQRFYDFVADCDPAIVDAWHFGENNKPGGLSEQVRNALVEQELKDG